MNDRFHYDALVDDALRSVVRRVLVQVAEKGLPGSHHFYISFRSTDPGVELPDYLLAKYPEEMTIVLQHQYWDLVIHDDYFEVSLSFNKLQEHIKVPFMALSAFVDPSVRFGLQFDRKDTAGNLLDKTDAVSAAPASLPAPEPRPRQVRQRRNPRPSPRTPPRRSSSSTASEKSRRNRGFCSMGTALRARSRHVRIPVPGNVSARSRTPRPYRKLSVRFRRRRPGSTASDVLTVDPQGADPARRRPGLSRHLAPAAARPSRAAALDPRRPRGLAPTTSSWRSTC